MKLSPQTTKKKTITKYWIIGGITFILIATLGYLAYAYQSKAAWPFQTKESDTTSENRDVNQVDYGPPSKEDVEQSQTGKQNATNEGSSQNNATPTSPSTTKKSVAVGISFADVVDNKVEIRAFTPSITEGGGICTAQLQKGSMVVSVSSEAFIDSSSSVCNPIYIDMSKFPEKGNWSLTVTYSSNSAEGVSEKIGVTL